MGIYFLYFHDIPTEDSHLKIYKKLTFSDLKYWPPSIKLHCQFCCGESGKREVKDSGMKAGLVVSLQWRFTLQIEEVQKTQAQALYQRSEQAGNPRNSVSMCM